MAKEVFNSENPHLFRYAPNVRDANFQKYGSPQPYTFEKFGDSITDKESFKLNLVGARGVGATGVGSSMKPFYMFQDGKYNADSDFSFALRPDISPVQLDKYIEQLKTELKSAESIAKEKLSKELKNAEKQKEVAQTSPSNKSDNISSSAE